MTRLLAPLPALCAAASAVWLAISYIDHGWGPPVVAVALTAAVVLGAWAIGWIGFRNRPHRSGLLLEAGLLLPAIASAIVGAVLLWLGIEKAPPKDALPRESAPYAALVAAFTAYLGAVLIKPDTPFTSPVKRAIERKFAGEFKQRRDELERDARNAVQEESYSAEAVPPHDGHLVYGWDWTSRRRRTKHIQDQLDRS
jgi:hypothetical protein